MAQVRVTSGDATACETAAVIILDAVGVVLAAAGVVQSTPSRTARMTHVSR